MNIVKTNNKPLISQVITLALQKRIFDQHKVSELRRQGVELSFILADKYYNIYSVQNLQTASEIVFGILNTGLKLKFPSIEDIERAAYYLKNNDFYTLFKSIWKKIKQLFEKIKNNKKENHRILATVELENKINLNTYENFQTYLWLFSISFEQDEEEYSTIKFLEENQQIADAWAKKIKIIQWLARQVNVHVFNQESSIKSALFSFLIQTKPQIELREDQIDQIIARIKNKPLEEIQNEISQHILERSSQFNKLEVISFLAFFLTREITKLQDEIAKKPGTAKINFASSLTVDTDFSNIIKTEILDPMTSNEKTSIEDIIQQSHPAETGIVIQYLIKKRMSEITAKNILLIFSTYDVTDWQNKFPWLNFSSKTLKYVLEKLIEKYERESDIKQQFIKELLNAIEKQKQWNRLQDFSLKCILEMINHSSTKRKKKILQSYHVRDDLKKLTDSIPKNLKRYIPFFKSSNIDLIAFLQEECEESYQGIKTFYETAKQEFKWPISQILEIIFQTVEQKIYTIITGGLKDPAENKEDYIKSMEPYPFYLTGLDESLQSALSQRSYRKLKSMLKGSKKIQELQKKLKK